MKTQSNASDGTPAAGDNPILAQFHAALYDIYGKRQEQVVLFGSQARGDAGPDSDYDVAVFLNDSEQTFNRWVELDKLAALRVKFRDETGTFFDARLYLSTQYQEHSPLMHEIRSDGIQLVTREGRSIPPAPTLSHSFRTISIFSRKPLKTKSLPALQARIPTPL